MSKEETVKNSTILDRFVFGHNQGLFNHYKGHNQWHDNWAWLMQVVEKIEERHTVRIQDNTCVIYRFGSEYEVLVDREADTKIAATYLACLEYVKSKIV